MPYHEPDSRVLNLAGDIDDRGQPLPMSVDALRARAEKWAVSEHTPVDVARQLARSRQIFVDGYFTYENFIDAVVRSLQAVEAALRVRLNVGTSVGFAQLIDRAKALAVISEETREALHAGRAFRNSQIHATTMAMITPAIAAGMIAASHKLIADLFDTPAN